VSPRLALTIGAIAALIFGLLLTLAPGPMLAGFGLEPSGAATVVSRDVGVTLIGLGIINWLARDATGSALRGLLIGNIAVQVLEIVVNGYALGTGALPASSAPGLLIHLILGSVFLLGLRGANTPALAPACRRGHAAHLYRRHPLR
jgi:hypothetical protein